jgi:hypothetical protein
MEKNYCVVINNSPLIFKSLDGVKKWFKKCGVKKRLELENEEYVDLDNLESIVGNGEVEIYNECMCEMGDDYCSISLYETAFED